MDMLFYIVLGGLVITIASVIHYQMMLKRHQKELYGKGGSSEDVVSLDDEDVSDGPKYTAEPSKAFMLTSFGLTFLLIIFWVIKEPPKPPEEFTFDQIGVIGMCKQILEDDSITKGSKGVIIVSPDDYYLYHEYLNSEPDQSTGKKPVHRTIQAVMDTLGRGGKVIFTPDSVVPVIDSRATASTQETRLTPTRFADKNNSNKLMEGMKDARVIVSLCGYYAPKPEDNSFGGATFAVFSREPRLYDFIEYVSRKEVGLATLSKGAYNNDESMPNEDAMDPDGAFAKHFLTLTPNNVRHIAGEYRQYIGVYPISDNEYVK